MLANLRNLFLPGAVAKTLKTFQPLASTVMDTLFKNRPTHPLPLIGKAELETITKTVPMVRRDGTPISLSTEKLDMEFVAPLPVKVKVNVSASEVNDLRAMLGNSATLELWRRNKLEQIRNTIRDTLEGICSVVMATGRISWPVQLEGGGIEYYEIDYGPLNTYPDQELHSGADLSEVYKLLRGMEQTIRKSGVGGKVEFFAGADVGAVFLDIAESSRTTTQNHPYHLELGQGKILVGKYAIHYMDETYPEPLGGEWIDKLGPDILLAVATDSPGTIWYCAIDSISANNAALPLHIVPVARDDDSGITLIGQTKPLPARRSKASCKCKILF